MSEEQHHHLALPQGTRIRDFEFHRVLGHGGFGITYLGWNVTLDIPVAIKEYLPTDLAARKGDQSVVPQSSQVVSDFQWGLERFLDEARTLARLQHPNIVRVHQYFEAHGTAYIAMDYVEGEDLSAYLERKGTLSEDELKGILSPLLDALEVVHGADFLHRDIKPGNIVLRDVDGSPVLLDFGAARQAIGAKSRSVTSIVTPGYAPIEQYSSRGRQGAWTDIYALGGVCYRVLTGEVPDDATDRMRDDPLIPVSQRCAGQASRGFLLAIDVALSVDEGDRPQSVGAWRAVLAAEVAEAQEQAADTAKAQKDEVSDATIVGHVEQDAPPSEPQKKPLFKRLAVVLGVVALLVGGKMYVDHAEQVALEKQRQEQAVEKARLAAEQAEQQRQEQATLEQQRQEQAALEQQRREQAALEQQRQEQATLEQQRREQAALEQQRQEQAALEKQRQEQAALEQQRQEQAALEKQRQEQAALEKQRQEEQAVLKEARASYSLHKAARNNASETVEVLLNGGADANAKDNSGNTPLHGAAWNNAAKAALVLLNGGADANAKDNAGFTPLHVAAAEDASAMAEVLLKHGADVHAKTNAGFTPLHVAAAEDASAMAEVLLKHGADVHAKTNAGFTPLHVAAAKDASATAEVLLKQGADVHAKDRFGHMPLHYAARNNASATTKVLRRYGGRK